MHNLENVGYEHSKTKPRGYKQLVIWPAMNAIPEFESPSKNKYRLEGPRLDALNPEKHQLLHIH